VSEAAAAASAPLAPEPASLEFRGSALALLPLHLFRLLALAAFCLTLPSGLGRGAVGEVHGLLDPVGLGAPWREAESAMSALPLISNGVVGLLLVVLFLASTGWISRYRLRHTYAWGEPVVYQRGCNPFVGAFTLWLVMMTAGLASPWVLAWNRRRTYRRCESRYGPMGFAGGGLEIAWYGALSLLTVPFVFVSMGLIWVVPKYLWLRWEQGNLLVPTPRANRSRRRGRGASSATPASSSSAGC
jgi:hypothetical protein